MMEIFKHRRLTQNFIHYERRETWRYKENAKVTPRPTANIQGRPSREGPRNPAGGSELPAGSGVAEKRAGLLGPELGQSWASRTIPWRCSRAGPGCWEPAAREAQGLGCAVSTAGGTARWPSGQAGCKLAERLRGVGARLGQDTADASTRVPSSSRGRSKEYRAAAPERFLLR